MSLLVFDFIFSSSEYRGTWCGGGYDLPGTVKLRPGIGAILRGIFWPFLYFRTQTLMPSKLQNANITEGENKTATPYLTGSTRGEIGA